MVAGGTLKAVKRRQFEFFSTDAGVATRPHSGLATLPTTWQRCQQPGNAANNLATLPTTWQRCQQRSAANNAAKSYH